MGKEQAQLAGFKPKHIAELEKAASALREVRGQRMELTEQEIELADAVVKIMKKHDVKTYRVDDEFDVVLKPGKDKVSVKRVQERAEKEVKEEKAEA